MNRPHRGHNVLRDKIHKALHRRPHTYTELMKATNSTRGTLHTTVRHLRKHGGVTVWFTRTHSALIFLGDSQ